MLVEGRNAVTEALRSGVPVSHLMIARGVRPDRSLDELVALAREHGAAVDHVDRRTLDELSERGAHQGVMARIPEFEYGSLSEILEKARGKHASLLVALDHVTDVGNLGAIARSAEVAGADGLILPKRRSASVEPGAYKTAAGALAWLSVARETNLVRALDRCRQDDYWIVGASEHAETSVWSAPIEGRVVIVLGSEGRGLSRLVAERCDVLVRLPVAGHVRSLNVAQAASVLAYEWLRRSCAGAP